MVLPSNKLFSPRGHNRIQHENLHPHVYNWKKCVRRNGGTVSNKTLYAIDWFYKSLKKTSVFPKIKVLNCVVPDDLMAAMTPLIDATGAYRWIANNILPSSLDIDGIRNTEGIFGNSYVQTGFIPLSHFPSNGSNGGITFYVSNAFNPIALAQTVFGAQEIAGDSFFAQIYGPGSSSEVPYGQIFDENGLGVDSSFDGGYYSFNRLSASSNAFYRALRAPFGWRGNSTILHYTADSNTGAPNFTPPNFECYFLALDSEGAGPGPLQRCHPTQAFSFISSHFGLTADESSIFYHLIELFRMRIGGGYGKYGSS